MTTWQKALLLYLAFSGAYGLYSVLTGYLPLLRPYPFAAHPGLWLAGGGFFALFAALGLSAVGVWRTHRYSWPTLALQIVQLVGFCVGGYKYQFVAGTSLKCLYEGNRLEVVFKPVTAESVMGMNLPQEFLYINAVPLLIIYLLKKHFLPKHAGNPVVVTG